MATEDVDYSSPPTATNKRKYDEASPPSSRRPTGFSAPILPPQDSSLVDFENAKKHAQEIANRLLNSAEAKRSKPDISAAYDSPVENFVQKAPVPSFTPYGYQGSSQESKSIDIPNGKVGMIIGKAGETIKQLQAQSGAKIQVTRDMDADPYSQTRKVDLMGTQDQIERAEQLINDVLVEAETGGSGAVSRRVSGQQPGANQYVTKIPNNKVGLVIGKGGETIKSMQAQSNARIQVIPLRLPPGDTSTERTLQIDGTPEQIEIAKQLVNEVISENRVRNPSMGGQYPQQGYQAPPPTSWTPPGPPMQQPGYGYMQQQQQPGAYPTSQTQYNASQPPQYPGYPPQPVASGGYSTGWEQSTGAPNQQAPQYDSSGYSYPQQPASGYNQQAQGYSQDGYGYAQPQSNPTQGYDQQQGYGSAPSYGGPPNSTTTTTTTTATADGDTTKQAPPPAQPAASAQQGYGTATQQQGYGLPTSQPGYGYGPSYGASQPAGAAQYGQPAYAQSGYGAPPYGAPPMTQQGYGQQPPPYASSYGGGYSQPPPAYSADTNAAPTSQAVPPTGVTQASPKS